MSIYRFFGSFILVALYLGACSNKSSQKVIIADAIEGQSRQFIKKAAQNNDWTIHERKGTNIMQEDSLAKFSSLVFPSSHLNQLNYRSLNALKRYLEAGGGLIVVKDEPIDQPGWPWLQKWNRKDLGKKLIQDRVGRLYLLSADASRQQWKEALTYVAGEYVNPDYEQVRTPAVPDSSRYTREVLTQGLDEPMEMAVFPNKDVLFVERKGGVKLYDSRQKKLKSIAQFEVFSGIEDGLLGVTLDPDYTENHWVYFYYAAPDSSVSRLSRMKLKNKRIDKTSEEVLMEIPTQRKYCCHSAGYLQFGPAGRLYLATGDNTNADDPYKVGYPPVDERSGHELADDQATAANTLDLRGKILRIKPTPNGGYKIPKGNLFPEGTPKTRPEIYTMGLRNPFRFAVDQKTGILYWGEVGPNTNVRGRDGTKMSYDELNRAAKPGFYGWPYFLGNNDVFPMYDFATGEEGSRKAPSHPINDSPNNTGLQALPAAQPAMVWYGPNSSQHFPKVGSGGASLMAGFVYHSDQYNNSLSKLSRYYDGKLFIYDWVRDWIMAVTLDEEGKYMRMEPFLDHTEFDSPMDMQIGPDGALYVLEYGSNWFSKNKDAKLVRISYKEGNREPIAAITVDKTYGGVPLTVQLSAGESKDYDKADNLHFKWNLNGESLSGKRISYTFKNPGDYKVILTAEDNHGGQDTTAVHIKVGNSPPSVQINSHSNTSFYWDKEVLNYQVKITDKEDEPVDTSRAHVSFGYLEDEKEVQVILSGNDQYANIRYRKGEQLINSLDCQSCHARQEKSIGPSFMAVADRYEDQEVTDQLSKKIIHGGSGNWGSRPMPPHPDLSLEDAQKVVQYILSLNDNNEEQLPLSGSLTLNEHSDNSGGAYLLSAHYRDKGAHGIPPLQGQAHIVLGNPRLQAEDYDKGNVNIVHIPTENRGYINGIKPGKYIMFKSRDLTGIQTLTYRVQRRRTGGRVELHIDDPEGSLVSSAQVLAAQSQQWQTISAEVKQTEGIYDLYFVFKNEKSTGQQLFNIDWIYFSND